MIYLRPQFMTRFNTIYDLLFFSYAYKALIVGMVMLAFFLLTQFIRFNYHVQPNEADKYRFWVSYIWQYGKPHIMRTFHALNHSLCTPILSIAMSYGSDLINHIVIRLLLFFIHPNCHLILETPYLNGSFWCFCCVKFW